MTKKTKIIVMYLLEYYILDISSYITYDNKIIVIIYVTAHLKRL